MPTYEFRCPQGHDFEKFYRSINSAPAEVRCPRCDIVASRLMSAGGGLVFKGSGFYITDYGKDGKKKQEAPAAAKSEGVKAEGGKPDSPGSEGSGQGSSKSENARTDGSGKSESGSSSGKSESGSSSGKSESGSSSGKSESGSSSGKTESSSSKPGVDTAVKSKSAKE